MTKQEKKQKYCLGCRNNYYNHGNNSVTGECWSLDDAKVVWKYEVGIWEDPPYKNKKKRRVLDCYRKKGSVFVNNINKAGFIGR